DVIIDRGDMWGEGVNVAARLEAMAEPGGLCVSGRVHDELANKLDIAFEDLGERQLKNIAPPVRVYRTRPDGAGAAGLPAVRGAKASDPVVTGLRGRGHGAAARPSARALIGGAAVATLGVALVASAWWLTSGPSAAPAQRGKDRMTLASASAH